MLALKLILSKSRSISPCPKLPLKALEFLLQLKSLLRKSIESEDEDPDPEEQSQWKIKKQLPAVAVVTKQVPVRNERHIIYAS